MSFYLGEDNVAILDLNTFEFLRLEINRYDMEKNLIEEKAGFMQFGIKKFQDGTSMSFNTSVDRGYSDVTVTLNKTSVLSFNSVSSYLCSGCLTGLMNRYTYIEEHWNIALLNFKDKTVRPLEEYITRFGTSDFIVKSTYDKETNKISLLIWYSPLRYN